MEKSGLIEMLLMILSIFDMLSGLVLLAHTSPLLQGLVGYMAAYSLLKGVLSFLSSIGIGYYFDWMGMIDVMTGAMLLLLVWGFSFGFVQTIGAIAILKGAYSLLKYIF